MENYKISFVSSECSIWISYIIFVNVYRLMDRFFWWGVQNQEEMAMMMLLIGDLIVSYTQAGGIMIQTL